MLPHKFGLIAWPFLFAMQAWPITISVLGAVSTATACILPHSVSAAIAQPPKDGSTLLSVEHPSGEFSVDLNVVMSGDRCEVKKSALLRTARLISKGDVYIPSGIWEDEVK